MQQCLTHWILTLSFIQDPYTDQDTLGRFVAEVEKFEKMVESLNKPTLSGPTALEKEWKVTAGIHDPQRMDSGRALAFRS